MSVRLEWDGKPTHVERLNLPFQTVETINESRATRQRDRDALFAEGTASGQATRNLLVWGDNKLVMSSLLEEYAGQGSPGLYRPALRDWRRLFNPGPKSATQSL